MVYPFCTSKITTIYYFYCLTDGNHNINVKKGVKQQGLFVFVEQLSI